MANIFEKNKTYLGDCLELMPQMESRMFDMILCDLPYGTTACKWDEIIPFEQLWKEYSRLIKTDGAIILTASQPFTTKLINSNIKDFRYELIWQKTRPTGFFTAKKQPMKIHENICVFYKKQPTYNPIKTKAPEDKIDRRKTLNPTINPYLGGIKKERVADSGMRYPTSVQLFASLSKKGQHPTEKPLDMFEWLIKTYSNEGDLILDNCAGSGTTGEACFNTGRNYIQIEKEQEYFSLILGREKSFNKKDLYDGTLFETQM